MSLAIKYLRDEVRNEWRLAMRMKDDPARQAVVLDMLRFFDARLDAAALMEQPDNNGWVPEPSTPGGGLT